MIAKKESWNIVLAGLWNRAIFTPEWVGRLLFKQPEVETLISVMPHMPLIYRNQQVSMEVATSRLVFRPRSISDAALRATEDMAHKVLGTLKDTPLLGVGINFAFAESVPRRDLVALFDLDDSPKLTEDGWDTDIRRLVRRLRKGDDVLNLTLTLEGQTLDAEFNFHSDTTENAASLAAVNGRIIRLRDAALRILEHTYDLRIESGDDDNG